MCAFREHLSIFLCVRLCLFGFEVGGGGGSGGAMVLGKLPVPGRPTIWMTVGQGPIVLAVGAGGRLFGIFFSHLSLLFSLSSSLGDGPI